MFVKQYLITSSNIERDSFIYNMIGNMLNTFQSFIMLVFITRALNLYEAGIFTIAYSNASLFLSLGKYGMRNFQVSDVRKEYSFDEYKYSRYITVFFMLSSSALYTLYIGSTNHYSTEKSCVLIAMCIFKSMDAIEDVYHGYYQQNNRLDVAGKCMTGRMLLTMLAFIISLIVFKNLFIAIIISTVTTLVCFTTFTKMTYFIFTKSIVRTQQKNITRLLKECFPLFLSSFLAFYIQNAPKYAIDTNLNDELQACYGFIAMPVFLVGMLNNFIFTPMISKLSVMWENKEKNKFSYWILRQIFIISGLTIICEIGGYMCGIPILSFVYKTPLSIYRADLLILLLGGGFLAISGILVTILTIMRNTKAIVTGYIIVSIIAYIISPFLVSRYAIRGATMVYLILMILLSLLFIVFTIYKIRKN